MGLKILHSADWHLDSPFASFREDQRENLKKAQREIPGKIAMACRQEACDLVLLAGDLFDGPWTRDTLDLVRDALGECRVPVMIAPGNHDPWGKNSPWYRQWPENVHIFGPELSSFALPQLDTRVYGAGFSSMDCPSLLDGFSCDGTETWQIGLFHGDPVNPGSPYNPITTAQIRKSKLSYLALGHIHSAGGLEVENTVCGWPGCPMGRGWDETGEKGYLLVNLEEGVQVQTASLDTPRFYDLRTELEGEEEPDLDSLLPVRDDRNFYRITLEGYGSVDLQLLQREWSAIANLELRDRTLDPRKLWDQAGEDSLRGAFFGRLRQAAEEADPEMKKKILLAAEISQKLLDGREVQLP